MHDKDSSTFVGYVSSKCMLQDIYFTIHNDLLIWVLCIVHLHLPSIIHHDMLSQSKSYSYISEYKYYSLSSGIWVSSSTALHYLVTHVHRTSTSPIYSLSYLVVLNESYDIYDSRVHQKSARMCDTFQYARHTCGAHAYWKTANQWKIANENAQSTEQGKEIYALQIQIALRVCWVIHPSVDPKGRRWCKYSIVL